MDYSGDAARQAKDMAEAWQRSSAGSVATLARQLNISREIAEYLVKLEARIRGVESDRLPLHIVSDSRK